jgi:tetratricopeptide (TPR) repeat protein
MAESTLTATARLAAKMDDLRGEAVVLNTLGGLQARRDAAEDRKTGPSNLRRSVMLSTAIGDRKTEAYARLTLAGILMKSGHPARMNEAELHLRRRLELENELPGIVDKGRAADSLGRLLARSGPDRRAEAVELLEQGIERSRRRRDDRQLGLTLEALGDVLSRGDRKQRRSAEALLNESLELGRSRGDKRHQAIVLGRLAALAEREGRPDDAARMLGEVVELNQARRDFRRADEAKRRIDALKRARRPPNTPD